MSILLFIISLGVLVSIHEFGHFIIAKLFKVYCSDFSIGFGYKILKIGRLKENEKKTSLIFVERKNPKVETNFSIGIIPLGGYVAMLDDDADIAIKSNPDLKGRSLEEKSWWQKILIMSAGIIMNFVLAFLLFTISSTCFEQVSIPYTNLVSISNEEDFNNTFTFESEKIESTTNYGKEDEISYFINVSAKKDNENIYCFNDPKFPIRIAGSDSYYALVFDSTNLTYENLDFATSFKLAVAKKDEDNNYFPILKENSYEYYKTDKNTIIEPIRISFRKCKERFVEDNEVDYKIRENINSTMNLKVLDNGNFKNTGLSIFKSSYKNSFGEGLKEASINFGESTKVIGRTLLSLFYSKETWEQVGGPVAIFTQTSTILNSYPFYVYISVWASISVNLALFNLIPIPGLDGFQILVTIIEAIGNLVYKIKNKKLRKETSDNSINIGEKEKEFKWRIPKKIKTILSYGGLVVIFLLAIVIFFKDIISLM